MFTKTARPLATRRIAAAAAALAGMLLAVTACSSGAPAATTTRAHPVAPLATASVARSSPTARSMAPLAPQPPAPKGLPHKPYNTAAKAKTLFVALVRYYCASLGRAGRRTDASAATVRRGPTKNEWLVTTKDGEKLLINTSTVRVYSTDGPDGILPATYAWDCDVVVFPGRLD